MDNYIRRCETESRTYKLIICFLIFTIPFVVIFSITFGTQKSCWGGEPKESLQEIEKAEIYLSVIVDIEEKEYSLAIGTVGRAHKMCITYYPKLTNINTFVIFPTRTRISLPDGVTKIRSGVGGEIRLRTIIYKIRSIYTSEHLTLEVIGEEIVTKYSIVALITDKLEVDIYISPVGERIQCRYPTLYEGMSGQY